MAGREHGHSELNHERASGHASRGHLHSLNLSEKVRLVIAVTDNFVEPTVKAIIKGAKTGNIGDGKIFITNLEACIRIRTEENGGPAIG